MNGLWRSALAAAMVLLIFEGALRKWVLPEAQASLYLAKDALLAVVYLAFVMTRGIPVPRKASTVLLLTTAAALYGGVEILNPALPEFSLALIGWKSYFWYAPLLIVVPYLFSTTEEMLRWLRRYALLAIPVAALGILQFFSATDSPINLNVEHEQGTSAPVTFGELDRVRVVGPFAFISGYSEYLTAMALLCIGLAAGKQWKLGANRYLFAALGVSLAAMLATGSRAPIYALALTVPAYLLLSSVRGDLSAGVALRAAATALAGLLVVGYFAAEPLEAFSVRAGHTDDTVSRFLVPLEEPFRLMEHGGFWGFGIGATHQSAAYLVGSRYPWWTNGLTAEAETTRVMMELGPIGFVLIFCTRVLLFASALRAAFVLLVPQHRALALALAMFLGLHVPGPVIFNVTAGLYYWFAGGLLFALFRLEQVVAEHARRRSREARRTLPVAQ